MLTDFHSVQVFPPEFDSDLRPGLGYFAFKKFGLGVLHCGKESTMLCQIKDTTKVRTL
jgi:hypothetical protein